MRKTRVWGLRVCLVLALMLCLGAGRAFAQEIADGGKTGYAGYTANGCRHVTQAMNALVQSEKYSGNSTTLFNQLSTTADDTLTELQAHHCVCSICRAIDDHHFETSSDEKSHRCLLCGYSGEHRYYEYDYAQVDEGISSSRKDDTYSELVKSVQRDCDLSLLGKLSGLNLGGGCNHSSPLGEAEQTYFHACRDCGYVAPHSYGPEQHTVVKAGNEDPGAFRACTVCGYRLYSERHTHYYGYSYDNIGIVGQGDDISDVLNPLYLEPGETSVTGGASEFTAHQLVMTTARKRENANANVCRGTASEHVCLLCGEREAHRFKLTTFPENTQSGGLTKKHVPDEYRCEICGMVNPAYYHEQLRGVPLRSAGIVTIEDVKPDIKQTRENPEAIVTLEQEDTALRMLDTEDEETFHVMGYNPNTKSHYCTICFIYMAHDFSAAQPEDSHICAMYDACGLRETHSYAPSDVSPNSHICSVCEKRAPHSFPEGQYTCEVCGDVCAHEKVRTKANNPLFFLDSCADRCKVCEICGCCLGEHHYNANGVCVHCRAAQCDHQYVHGYCEKCHAPCPNTANHKANAACAVCAERYFLSTEESVYTYYYYYSDVRFIRREAPFADDIESDNRQILFTLDGYSEEPMNIQTLMRRFPALRVEETGGGNPYSYEALAALKPGTYAFCLTLPETTYTTGASCSFTLDFKKASAQRHGTGTAIQLKAQSKRYDGKPVEASYDCAEINDVYTACHVTKNGKVLSQAPVLPGTYYYRVTLDPAYFSGGESVYEQVAYTIEKIPSKIGYDTEPAVVGPSADGRSLAPAFMPRVIGGKVDVMGYYASTGTSTPASPEAYNEGKGGSIVLGVPEKSGPCVFFFQTTGDAIHYGDSVNLSTYYVSPLDSGIRITPPADFPYDGKLRYVTSSPNTSGTLDHLVYVYYETDIGVTFDSMRFYDESGAQVDSVTNAGRYEVVATGKFASGQVTMVNSHFTVTRIDPSFRVNEDELLNLTSTEADIASLVKLTDVTPSEYQASVYISKDSGKFDDAEHVGECTAQVTLLESQNYNERTQSFPCRMYSACDCLAHRTCDPEEWAKWRGYTHKALPCGHFDCLVDDPTNHLGCEACGAMCDGVSFAHASCPHCGGTCAGEGIAHIACAHCGAMCAGEPIGHNGCPKCGGRCNGAGYQHVSCAACGGFCDGTGYQHLTCPNCGKTCDGFMYAHGFCDLCHGQCDGAAYQHMTCPGCGAVCDGMAYVHASCAYCGGTCAGHPQGIDHFGCSNCHEFCAGSGIAHGACPLCGGKCNGARYDHLACPACGGLCDGDFVRHRLCENCGGYCDGAALHHTACPNCGGLCDGAAYAHIGCANCGGLCDGAAYAHIGCPNCGGACDGTAYAHIACPNCGGACDGAKYAHVGCPHCGGECDGAKYVHVPCAVCGGLCDGSVLTHLPCPNCGGECDGAKYWHIPCRNCAGDCNGATYDHGTCWLCGGACDGEEYLHIICSACGGACDGGSFHRACAVCAGDCNGEGYVHGACAFCKGVCDGTAFQHKRCPNCGGACEGYGIVHLPCPGCGNYGGYCDGEKYVHVACPTCGALCDNGCVAHTECPYCHAKCVDGVAEHTGCPYCKGQCTENGVVHESCPACGGACDGTHPNWHVHCDACGATCDAENFQHAECAVCGAYCDGKTYAHNACPVCGGLCDGTKYAHNACTVCEGVCDGTAYAHKTCTICEGLCDGTKYVHKTCAYCHETCDGATYHKPCKNCLAVCDGSGPVAHTKCPACGESCAGGVCTHGTCKYCDKPCKGVGVFHFECPACHQCCYGYDAPNDFQHISCQNCPGSCDGTTYDHIPCQLCGGACDGENYLHKTCENCHATCDGTTYTHKACAVCGGACDGTAYAHKACTVCGGACDGTAYAHKTCTVCEGLCDGTAYAHTACAVCGGVCEGTAYAHKTCAVCESLCDGVKYHETCAYCHETCDGATYHKPCKNCLAVCDGSGPVAHAKCPACGEPCVSGAYTHGTCKYCDNPCKGVGVLHFTCPTCHQCCYGYDAPNDFQHISSGTCG